MIKNSLLLAISLLPMAAAFGYSVDTSHPPFYFEDREVFSRNDGGWIVGDTIENVTNRPLTVSSAPNFYRIAIEKKGVAMKQWGAASQQNIAYARWYDNTASTNFLYSYDSYFENANTVYLYVWLKWMRYNLDFVSNGGAAVSPMSDICYTNNVSLPTTTRTGYDFQGWTNGTFTTALTGSKTGNSLGVSEDGETITLYAKWKAIESTVSFDKNGDGDAVDPSTMQVTYDSTYGDLPSPAWTGHTFTGWYTDTQGGSPITASTKVSITSVQTLYARWTTNTYTVTFNPNGGSTPTSSKTVTYGETYGVLPTPTWDNHNFQGWYTESSGGTQVSASDTVSITEAQTLYAQWTANMYTVTFYNTDNTVLLSTNVTYGTMLTPPAIILGENRYLEWWDDGTIKHDPNQPIEVKGTMSLRPVDKTRQATLTLACDPGIGGTAGLVEGSLSGDAGRTVKIAATPDIAYDFSGWSDGSMDLTNTVAMTTNATLTAYFTQKTNEVVFLDWDGVTLLCPTQLVAYGTNAVPPETALRPGYTFTGWSADFSHVISNMTILAQYGANRYTVVYDPNGGSSAMTNDTFTYDVEYRLQSNACTRALSEFLGWASRPDAATNEVEYVDRATVSNLTDAVNGTYTLYAVWRSLLSDLSVAADCTNLILTCNNANGLWVVDETTGFKSGSSAKAVVSRMSQMIAGSAGAGTVTFWTKTISPAKLLFNKAPMSGIATDGEWKCYSFELGGDESFLWDGVMYEDEHAACWVDQVHWYPNRFVTVDSTKLTDEEKTIIKEAILQRWDAILGANATSVSTVVATGLAVTNAAALLNGGALPDVEPSGSSATLIFNEVVVQDVSISEFWVTNLPTATLRVLISPHTALPEVGVWGAPTLTSDWSQVITTVNDSSAFLDEGIVSFEFDVSTNRFFKVITK